MICHLTLPDERFKWYVGSRYDLSKMLKYCLSHRIVLTVFHHKNLSNLSCNASQYNKRFLVGYMRLSSVSEKILYFIKLTDLINQSALWNQNIENSWKKLWNRYCYSVTLYDNPKAVCKMIDLKSERKCPLNISHTYFKILVLWVSNYNRF